MTSTAASRHPVFWLFALFAVAFGVVLAVRYGPALAGVAVAWWLIRKTHRWRGSSSS